MAGERKPPVDDFFDGLFDEAPKTYPTVPALAEEVTMEIPPETIEIDRDPPMAFALILPEMEAGIWQAGIQALVSVPEAAPPASLPREEWLAEARLLQSESAIADTSGRAAQLLIAAARAMEAAGEEAEAAVIYDEALARAPSAPDALRGRARLAESVGDVDEAHALWARLAGAAETVDERAFYGALSAEWTLARRGSLPAVALDALAPGPARALALVEESLSGGKATDLASALAAAGRAVGGTLGAALLEEAARFAAVALDATSASAHRAAARELEADADGDVFGRLRDAARMDARGAAKTLAQVLSDLSSASPPSALAQAVGRWAATLARQRGDAAGAGALYARLSSATAAAARDRIDFDLASGAVLDEPSLGRLRAGATSAVAAANLAWVEAGDHLRRGDHVAASALLANALEAQPDAVPLGLLAEDIAAVATDSAVRVSALNSWIRSDPARRAAAALDLAEARDGGGAGNVLAARAALQSAIEAAPRSALFWTVAAVDARSGRHADAAATLDYGADVWAASALGPGLRACAAAKIGLGDPTRAMAAFVAPDGLSDVGRALGTVAVARFAERAGDHRALRLALEAAATDDPRRRADLAVQRASSFAIEDGPARARALAEALAALPDHPVALPLYLLEPGVDSNTAAAALAAAGAASESSSTARRLYSLAAGSTLSLGDDSEGSFVRASELAALAPEDREARRAFVRAAARLAAGPRRRALAELPIDVTSPLSPDNEALLLMIGEARLEVGDPDRAAQALRLVGGGRFAAETRRAMVRLGTPAEGLPPGLLFGPPDEAAGATRATLTEVSELVRAGRWNEVVAKLERSPPHEAHAGPVLLAFLALIAEGHDLPEASARLLAAAVEASAKAATGGSSLGLPDLGRVAESDAETKLRLDAYDLAIGRLGVAESDRRAAAFANAGRARLAEAVSAGSTHAAAHWRAALAAEPTFLPAALALRRDAARRGDEAGASAACESEAACLMVPAHRVRALLLAAALTSQNRAADNRALELLRAALAIDPTHEGAFEKLRELLTRLGDHPALSAALAERIEVATNPFEVTSLRLARADLLAAALADPAGAQTELEMILRKQPEHVRALAKLSALLWDREAWDDAGEVYLKRTAIERDAGTLREIFLRLGHIYSERVPDAKRAAMAYGRVLSLDPDNYEALRALSDLYLAEGETKLALPVTDRLVARETDATRRTTFRVRLGEILMHAGDMRRAGTELRRAVDEAPRDVTAVSALAHFLERGLDPAGRKFVLDRAVGHLRHDLEGSYASGGFERGAFRALASLLALRERPHAALAAAQLFAALDTKRGVARAAATRPGCSLSALRKPEIDERAFPQGLPPGIRQILSLLGPTLRPNGHDLAQKLAQLGVSRADRKPRGAPPRPAFEAVAAELGVGDFDLFVKTPASGADPILLRAEPGNPPAVIIGAPLAELGPAALRFAAARALRLTATHLDTILALPLEEAGALLVGIIRQFVPEYRHAEVRDTLAEAEAVRTERLIPRKLKQQVLPFAVESAGPFDLAALYAAVRDGANAVGLLASADLPAALSVVLSISGPIAARSGSEPGLTLGAVAASPEAMTLVRFALSDDYDDLARALEG
jgi:Tfp pilus assembly protein PilF